MDCRGSCILFVCVFSPLITVECSSFPFGNRGMGLSMQSRKSSLGMGIMDQRILLHAPEPIEPINPMVGTSPCFIKCKLKPNPCNSYINAKGCPPPKNIPQQHVFNILPQQRFGNQPMNPFSFSTLPPPPTTTTTTTTTVTEKDFTGEQHNIFTTTTSPFPQSTTKATRGITVNPFAFWIINKK